MKTKLTISCIGAGNIAWHLCGGLSASYTFKQIFSRDIDHARQLSLSINALPIADLSLLDLDVDFILVAVPDGAISDVLAIIPSNYAGIIMHCSGSTEMLVLDKFNQFGVCYPLQTFSKQKEVALNQVPFFVEANTTTALNAISNIAKSLSPKVQEYSSTQRIKLHIAAVIACNFSNYMFDWAQQLVASPEVFQHLLPLIEETVQKVGQMDPKLAQTGPAKRKDLNTISKHISQLNDMQQKQAYQLISDMIQNRHAKEL